MKVAHALLLHGQTMFNRPQQDFWPLSFGKEGSLPDPKTCERNVNRMAKHGKYFAKDPFRFGPGFGLMVGVSVGTESLRAALVDANGWIVPAPPNNSDSFSDDDRDWHVTELPPLPGQTDLPPEELLERVAEAAWIVVDRALSDDRLTVGDRLPILGVTVALPTPLSRLDKVPTTTALGHHGWRMSDSPGVIELLAARLGLGTHRVHAINDANAVALAAAFDEIRSRADAGDGRFGRTLMALRIGGGLGVGTAVVGSPRGEAPRSAFLETRLIEGENGFAGELGHLPIQEDVIRDVERPPTNGLSPISRADCVCGRGKRDPCLQTVASATAFSIRMRASGIGVEPLLEGRQRHSISMMHSAMASINDQRQIRAQRDIGRLIGRVLASPVLLLNPSSITLAGSMAVDHVKSGIEDERSRWQHIQSNDLPLHLLTGRDNRFSVARGAAIAAFRGRLYRQFEKLDTPDRPLPSLTLKVSSEDIAPWNSKAGWKLF